MACACIIVVTHSIPLNSLENRHMGQFHWNYNFSYTEHSTVGLAQAWDQLDQLGMRMQHNLEQQIQARNQSGVSEEALREFSMMFKHFDKVYWYLKFCFKLKLDSRFLYS